MQLRQSRLLEPTPLATKDLTHTSSTCVPVHRRGGSQASALLDAPVRVAIIPSNRLKPSTVFTLEHCQDDSSSHSSRTSTLVCAQPLKHSEVHGSQASSEPGHHSGSRASRPPKAALYIESQHRQQTGAQPLLARPAGSRGPSELLCSTFRAGTFPCLGP